MGIIERIKNKIITGMILLHTNIFCFLNNEPVFNLRPELIVFIETDIFSPSLQKYWQDISGAQKSGC